MADTTLQADSARASTSRRLHDAYRRAKAEWDLVLYSENYEDGSDDAQSEAHTEALKRFLTEPADTPGDLATKLRVFRDEEAHDYAWADEAMSVLAADAHRLAYPGDRPVYRI